jgi:hypothetical protein
LGPLEDLRPRLLTESCLSEGKKNMTRIAILRLNMACLHRECHLCLLAAQSHPRWLLRRLLKMILKTFTMRLPCKALQRDQQPLLWKRESPLRLLPLCRLVRHHHRLREVIVHL